MFGLGLKSKLHSVSNRVGDLVTWLKRPRLVFRGRHENIAVIFSEPHDMPIGDRVMLYALVRGLKPRAYLEIGVRWGGSARIVCHAMEANGHGKAVGIDPYMSNFRPRNRELFGRFSKIEGFSPEETGKAAEVVGGKFDFVFIDAVHTYSAVKKDLNGVLEYLSETAHIVFHDAFHQGIDQAVEEFLSDNPEFTDLGILSRNAEPREPVSYAGLRVLRKGKTSFEALLGDAHQKAGLPAPHLSREFWDFDPYANRIGNPLGRPGK
jgi:predicted O-methyltransferase YrrM